MVVAPQVKALESHLGLRLVQRAARGIAPTVEGALLAAQLTENFGQMADAIRGLIAVETEQQSHVPMTPSFAVSWFTPRTQQFRIVYLGIDLAVNPSVEMVDFASSNCDVAIKFGSSGWQGLVYELLLPSGFVIVALPEPVDEDWQGNPEDPFYLS